MSLWTTIKDALGLTPPIRAGEPEPFSATGRAERAIKAMDGASLWVHVAMTPEGPRVRLDRMNGADTPLVVGDDPRLNGLFLDHNGDAFQVGCHLAVRPTETPNPDVRLYETSRFLLVGRPFHADATSAPGVAGHLMAVPGVQSLLLRDNLVSIEREPGTSWGPLDSAIPEALRAWFIACGGPLTAKETGSDDPDYNAVSQVMSDTVLPFVHGHGGDIRLIDVKDGVVTVQLFGACATCPASMLTLKGGVQRQLRERLPDIVHTVVAVDA